MKTRKILKTSMNFKEREQALASRSKLEDFIGVQKRAKYYAMHLENFIDTKDLVHRLTTVTTKAFFVKNNFF